MKKSYKVKEVVRLEDKLDYLEYQEDQFTDLYFPFSLATFIGLGMCSGYFLGEANSVWALIVGGALALPFGAQLLNMTTAEIRSERLRDRLDDIYKLMGSEFEKQVMTEYNKAR